MRSDPHRRIGDGNSTAARTAYQQALTILDDLDHPDADNIRTKLGALRTPATRSDQPQPDSNP